MEVRTYPEMNESIKKFLAMDEDDSVCVYALARIKELEKENKELKDYINKGVLFGNVGNVYENPESEGER